MRTGFLTALTDSGEMKVLADPTVPVCELNPLFKKILANPPEEAVKIQLWHSDVGVVKEKIFKKSRIAFPKKESIVMFSPKIKKPDEPKVAPETDSSESTKVKRSKQR